jgi:hypothetical protein
MLPPPQPVEDAGAKYALLIGVDAFRDPNIPALRYAKNDAAAVRDFLLHPELGKFRRENLHVLLDEEAAAGDIRSQFVYWLGAKVREEDHVWIYFAGYGARVYGGKSFLVAHDTNADDLPQSAIALTQLDEWLGLLPARRIALILDCSFGGLGRGRTLALNKTPLAREYVELSALVNDERRTALVAAGPDEIAREDDDAGLGLFTRILLQRMRATLLPNYGAEPTWNALHQYLAAEVSRQADLRGGAQTPVKIGGLPGTLPLFSEPARTQTPTQTEASPSERVQQLLQEAQQEINTDNLVRARELLHEIIALDPDNRRAHSGLRKLDEALQEDAEAANGTMISARVPSEKPALAHKLKAYDQFIWPYVGWWALVAAVWALFGVHNESASNATIFVTTLQYGFFGGLIGVVHASAVYFYKLAELRMKAKKLKRT